MFLCSHCQDPQSMHRGGGSRMGVIAETGRYGCMNCAACVPSMPVPHAAMVEANS